MKRISLLALTLVFVLLLTSCTPFIDGIFNSIFGQGDIVDDSGDNGGEDDGDDNSGVIISGRLAEISSNTDFYALETDMLPTKQADIEKLLISTCAFHPTSNFSQIAITKSVDNLLAKPLVEYMQCSSTEISAHSEDNKVTSYNKFSHSEKKIYYSFYHTEQEYNTDIYSQTFNGNVVMVTDHVNGGNYYYDLDKNQPDENGYHFITYNVGEYATYTRQIHTYDSTHEYFSAEEEILRQVIDSCTYDSTSKCYVASKTASWNNAIVNLTYSNIRFKVIDNHVVYFTATITTSYLDIDYTYTETVELKSYAFGSTTVTKPVNCPIP